MTLLLLLGCARITENHCEFTDRTAADDEELDFGQSVAEVLAALTPATVDAVDGTGAVHTVDVTLARGSGDAELVDATVMVDVIREGGPNTKTTWLGDGGCADVVTVPMEITLASDDGAVDVAGTGTLTNEAGAGAPPSFVTEAELAESDVLPEGTHGARTGGSVRVVTFQGAVTQVRVEAVATDGAREIVLWWDDP
jgi:hypothetical protein